MHVDGIVLSGQAHQLPIHVHLYPCNAKLDPIITQHLQLQELMIVS